MLYTPEGTYFSEQILYKLIDGIYYCTIAILDASNKYIDCEFIILIKNNKTLYESGATNSTQKQVGAIDV